MLHTLLIWTLAVMFFGAGLVNAISTAGTKCSFLRWGYPGWWGLA